MKISNLFSSRFMGETIDILSKALDFRTARQNVIAGNLANIDTPGYAYKEVKFNQELQKALERDRLRLETTNRKHFPSSSDPSMTEDSFTIQTQPAAKGMTNPLDLDTEMSKMVQNNLLYEAATKLLAKKFEALKTAIEAGRR